MPLNDSRSSPQAAAVEWIYALVAPFPTVDDEITLFEIIKLWRGQPVSSNQPAGLILSAETQAVFGSLWGAPHPLFVQVVAQDQLLGAAWGQQEQWAIIPFEQIEPRWKVLRVDGVSPLDQPFDAEAYPLAIRFGWHSNTAETLPDELPVLDAFTNRDPARFTSLILTGTTALVRNTAKRMEEMGVDYPAESIGEWLRGADFTHISNEASFFEDCPPAIPLRRGQRFCSDPGYIELFHAAGVDLIELTGNHLLDWGIDAFLFTLDLYEREGFQYYGGGRDAEHARSTLLIEHNGNRLALIGCNRAGPENIWASDTRPGPAACDFDHLQAEISRLVDLGYLPVVTIQHYEVENFKPMNLTLQEFERIARMGAVIVSGSQAHFAHGFGFVDNALMHYGLGNLFFDQMFPLHRRQFIDRHIFYDGRYIGVELLTAMLEDYSRPRPMTPEERSRMLEDYFRISGWLSEE
ncbi:MAG: CapA family protein [Bellilinea sp.]